MDSQHSLNPGSQPNWPMEGPKAASQPLTTLTSRLTTTTRRRFTEQDEDLERHLTAKRPQLEVNVLDTLQRSVLQHIRTRLQARGIQTTGLTVPMISWCLPTSNSLEQEWVQLLEDPLETTNSTLDRLLELELSTPTSLMPPSDATLFYVRTYAYSTVELLQVLQDLFDDGYEYHLKIYSWIQKLHELGPEDTIYLRYCGQTLGKRPWDRHKEDCNANLSGYTLRFLQTTALLVPHVIDNVLIQELVPARIVVPVPHGLRDIREQILIALIGDGCINIESGGKYGFIIQEQERDNFLLLKTNLVQLLNCHTYPCSREVRQDIYKYASDVEIYANANPYSTGTFRFSFTKKLQDVIACQATPMVTSNGYSVMVSIGSDIADSIFSDPRPFFSKKSPVRAAHDVMMVYDHFNSWEGHTAVIDEFATYRLAHIGHFPFVNLMPWAKKDVQDLPAACNLLRQYLSTSKPLVVLAYGHKVVNIALSSFSHGQGWHTRKHGDFLNLIGIPLTRPFNTAESSTDEDITVVIPSYHPGWHHYLGALRDRACSLFTAVSAIAWLAMTEAVRLSNTTNSRKAICLGIVKAVESKTDTNTSFGKALRRTKELYLKELHLLKHGILSEAELQDRAAKRQSSTGAVIADLKYLERKGRTIPGQKVVSAEELQSIRFILVRGAERTLIMSRDQQWIMAKVELGLILHCGYSRSAPNSYDRWNQARSLYKKSISCLKHAPDGSGSQAFIQWAKSVREGESYYFSATRVVDCVLDLPNLLCCFIQDEDLPDAKMRFDSSILDDNDMMRAACRDLVDWLEDLRIMGVFNSKMTQEEAMAALEPHWFKHVEKIDPSFACSLGKKKATWAYDERELDASESLNGVEVEIQPHKMSRISSQIRHGLRWIDQKGEHFNIENFILPSGVMPTNQEDRRFMFFEPEGLDIRDAAGQSLGLSETTRRLTPELASSMQPISQSRPVTLPLSTIILSLTGHRNKDSFLALWEQQTGLKVNEVLSSSARPLSGNDSTRTITMVYPASYFQGSHRALPSITGTIKPSHRNLIRSMLPAQPGDMLWLVDRFFLEHYPNGGVLDFIDAQYSPSSGLWFDLKNFCSTHKYIHHPHISTLQALIGFSHQSTYEKQSATAVLILCLEVLRTEMSKKKQSFRVRNGIGAGSTSSRTVITISSRRPAGAVSNMASPELVPLNISPPDIEELGESDSECDGEGSSLGEEINLDDQAGGPNSVRRPAKRQRQRQAED